MDADLVQMRADQIAALLEDRLGIRGAGLEAKLRGARRHLPRRVWRAAETLANAAVLAHHPKLMVQIDDEATRRAFDTCQSWLGRLGAGGRRWRWLTSLAAQMVLALLLMAGIGFVIARARGLI